MEPLSFELLDGYNERISLEVLLLEWVFGASLVIKRTALGDSQSLTELTTDA